MDVVLIKNAYLYDGEMWNVLHGLNSSVRNIQHAELPE